MKPSKTTNLGASSLVRYRAAGAILLTACLALALALVAVPSLAAVAVDAVSTGAANNLRTGTGYAQSITVSHTVSGTFRLLIVSVSININQNNGATVTTLPTYGGTNMVFVGQALNNNDNRVRIYSLVAPATGTADVVVNFSGLTTTPVGAVVGVISFVGVNQTAPLGAFASANGNASPATVNVTTVAGDLVIDTMSGNGNRTATVGAGQTQQWNLTSGGNDANLDSRAAGSTELATGTTTIMSYTLSGDAQWAIGAVPIKPTATSDLSLTKTGLALALPSSVVDYTITLTNGGPDASPAGSVTLTDTWSTTAGTVALNTVTTPAGWAWTYTPGENHGHWTNTASFAVGAATFHVFLTMPALTATVTNTADAVTTNYDPTPPTATQVTNIRTSPLSISKTCPTPAGLSSVVDYTITLTNGGPDASLNTVVTDTWTASASFDHVTTPAGWTWAYTSPNNFGTFTNATSFTGTATFHVFLRMPGTAGTVSNGATAVTTSYNPTPASTSCNTTVEAISDLSITKSCPSPAGLSSVVDYTIVLTNNGPNPSSNTVVTDTWSASASYYNITLPDATWTWAHTAGTNTGTFTRSTSWPSGSTATFHVHLTMPGSAGTVTNTASAVTSSYDPTPPSASCDTTVQVLSDLGLAFTTCPASAGLSSTAQYGIRLVNNGPNASASTTMSTSWTAGATLNGVTPPAGQGWTCTQPDTTHCDCSTSTSFASGATGDFTLILNTPATAMTLVNTASATSSSDPTPPSATCTTAVRNTSDLRITKTCPASATVSTTATYTITLTNDGPNDSPVTTVTDALAGGATGCSIRWVSGGTGWPVAPAACATGLQGALANGATATFTVTATMPAAAGTVTNTATATTNNYDPTTPNNFSCSHPVVAAASADLTITKTCPSSSGAGGTAQYTITVVNNGPGAAGANTVMRDLWSSNATFNSITRSDPTNWTCTTPGADTKYCDCTRNTSWPSGGTATFTLTLNTPTAGTVENGATVTSASTDPTPASAACSHPVYPAANSDIQVTQTGPSATSLSGAATYDITVRNNGPSNAASVTLTDTLSGASGCSIATVSAPGWICTNCSPTGCSGPLAVNAEATFRVTATTQATPGFAINTASVTTTSTDPNPPNDSSSWQNVVQSGLCATPGKDGTPGAALTGVINTYYPPNLATQTASPGDTSVALGQSSGAATQITAGDLILIMQMQDADINSLNDYHYGDGYNGKGWTYLNRTGSFEYVVATNTVPTTGGTLTFTGAGSSNGLLNSYYNAAPTAAKGQSRFQAVRVPQYASATTSSTLTALAWQASVSGTGNVGGILAFDVQNTLTLAGTVSVDALGFRGGGGQALTPGAGAYTDYRTLATVAANGNKGEGIAGTPRWMYTGAAVIDNTAEGYPNGSRAQGAPGNAGGGGTDGNPAANDQNTGGGGGGNGGAGGQGGFSWFDGANGMRDSGGRGGKAFFSLPTRLVMGGGGGSGARNNSTGMMASGGRGGGIVLIRAYQTSGSGIISANGGFGVTPNEDGGGGGGAGGTIMVLTQTGGLGGLIAQANGNNGTGNWETTAAGTNSGIPIHPINYHGPGGGGGGGAILLSSAPFATSVAGGQQGTTCTNYRSTYGATPGLPGIVRINMTPASTPGASNSGPCPTTLGITKQGLPEPVNQNQTLTYTIDVTNAGPYDATGVTLSDPLPTQVTYQSYTSSQGSCTYDGGTRTLTCALGAIPYTTPTNSKATVTITTVVNTAGTITNTASTYCTQTLTPVTATATNSGRYPTLVDLVDFQAQRVGDRVLLSWRTGYEVSNLGFNVYRDVRGERTLLTPAPVAGSALLVGQYTEIRGGLAYNWVDECPGVSEPALSYWLEDLDVNGARTLRGPFHAAQADSHAPAAGSAQAAHSPMLTEVGRACSPKDSHEVFEAPAQRAEGAYGAGNPKMQWKIAGNPAVKISIRKPGWYTVSQPELVAAGLPQDADPAYLQLYVEGTERAITVNTEEPGRFGPQDSIEFWADGLDTPYSDTRVAWLAWGVEQGRRIQLMPGPAVQPPVAKSYKATVERKDSLLYLGVLHNGEEDNIFGAMVSSTPLDQALTVSGVIPDQMATAMVEVTLQGLRDTPGVSPDHQVSVSLNGQPLGGMAFDGISSATRVFAVPQSSLIEGVNRATLAASGGATDVSAVDHIRITYAHGFVASGDALRFPLDGYQGAEVRGFTNSSIRLLDITDPDGVLEYTVSPVQDGSTYTLGFFSQNPGTRTFLAFAQGAGSRPAEVAANQPSSLNSPANVADHVIISHPSLLPALGGLQALRASQGLTSAIIDVNDIYDEFSYGSKTPYAIRDFLTLATSTWAKSPRFVLLVGQATWDPRNFLNLSVADMVPTKLVEVAQFETSSDDWFVDFNGSGLPAVAIGRLPAVTLNEASAMANKIVGYETDPTGAGWQREIILAADQNKGYDFEAETAALAALIPSNYTVTRVLRGQVGPTEARAQILSGFSNGKLLVDWVGHGSVEIWSGDQLLKSADAVTMANSPRLPFVVGMTCMNAYFQTPYQSALAEALMKSSGGGAIGVWASSGQTDPGIQMPMGHAFVQGLFGAAPLTIGEAAAGAKAAAGDMDVRRTWILFGDPATRLH